LAGNWLPYLLALVAAVCWGLYSNLASLWARNAESGGVALFILASGLVLAGLRSFFVESGQLTGPSLSELVYVAIFPTILAYVFWDTAMRKGKMILVASLSYFIPLLSTIINSIYLRVGVAWSLWIGCAFVIAGSFICKLSIEETT
jgi:drug/metabolite transporter (DMT)-like permease